MSRGKMGSGESNTTAYSVGATSIGGSSTVQPVVNIPAIDNDISRADGKTISPDDVAALVAKLATARAEQVINEKLSSANQAQALTAKMLRDATNMMNQATTMLDTITLGLKSSSDMQDRLEADIANIKGNAVAALSIFVSFFAFITVSINVFSKAGSVVSASALVLVFWCLLVGFNVIIGWQFNTLKNTGLAWFLLLLVSCLSVFAVVGMYYFSPELLNSASSVMESSKS